MRTDADFNNCNEILLGNHDYFYGNYLHELNSKIILSFRHSMYYESIGVVEKYSRAPVFDNIVVVDKKHLIGHLSL